MPTLFDKQNTPVVQFDPLSEVSPFTLFRRLREGRKIVLVDLRPLAERRRFLRGSITLPAADWLPEIESEVVLIDQDGAVAVEAARRMITQGRPRVRALFGGMQLYEFSLDPEVVGSDTFLESAE